MIIALAGYRGFVGSHIRNYFREHELILLDRKDLYGNIGSLAEKIKGSDVLINTAGFSISKRWTKRNRKKILSSRIDVTKNIVAAIQALEQKPSVMMNASAIGIYENNKEHTEDSKAFADNFLSEVVGKWEAVADELPEEVRLVKLRLGMVLGADGGALPRLFTLFRWGLGGVIGSGRQVYSFIHIHDVTGAIDHIISKKGKGIYNLTAPEPVNNRLFTKVVARKMRRPAFLPIPKFMVQIMMGKAAMIVTEGQTVFPKKLLDEGYKFTFATLDEAIENLVHHK